MDIKGVKEMIIFDKNYSNLNINDKVKYQGQELKIKDIDNGVLTFSNDEVLEIVDFAVLCEVELICDYLQEEGLI